MNSHKNLIVLLLAAIALLAACNKEEFLEKIPDKSLLIPTKLNDLQALLDNNEYMNQTPYLSLIGADDHYSTNPGLSGPVRNSYIWQADINEGEANGAWIRSYQQVFYANVVLEALQGIDQTAENQAYWNSLKGGALFFRAHAFYNLAQEFAVAYDINTAGSKPGIPIRLSADIGKAEGRGTVQATYDQVIKDLQEAIPLLPLTVTYKSRPNRVAALGLLARVYQTMERYEEASQYAGQALALYDVLIDYNTLNPASAVPFSRSLPFGLEEVIFYSNPIVDAYLINNTTTSADTLLYRLYDNNDLRKAIFFIPRTPGFFGVKGNYTGSTYWFTGIATDELYLIRAECAARKGDTGAAIQDLNTLLRKRWKAGTFTEIAASNAEDALRMVLTERRKELLFRNLRWTDLRRLNKDQRFAVTLKRVYLGKEYQLPPNDPKYVFPIPEDEIAASGIEQNER